MVENSSSARPWRTPLLVALLVLVIVVVVTAVVRSNDDSGAPADSSSSTAGSSTTDPGSPSSDSGSSSPSTSPSDSSPATTVPSVAPGVDLDAAVKQALKVKFPALIPSAVPAGWTLISADWSHGLWTLAFTTPGGGTAEVFQSKATEKELLATDLPGAQSAGTVDLKKYGTGTWNAYQGSTGFGLTRSFSTTTALVMGPDKDTAVTLTQQLLTAEDGQLPDDD